MQDFVARRAAFISQAPPGLESARTLAAMTDDAVRTLAEKAAPLHSGRWAIAALGGWGSGALQPLSDLDILVLSDAPAPKLKPFVEAVLYPLWDAGLKVGHQVRSPKEQIRGMRDDIKTCTAALTARPLAGDLAWADATFAACAADARKHRKVVLRRLIERDRPGSPFLLEPDVKDGAGGRRDYDELVWTAAVITGTVRYEPSALVSEGLMTAEELALVTDATEWVACARWELHRLGAKDRMLLDAAASLETDTAAIQNALGDSWLVLNRVRRRLAGEVVERDLPLTADEVFALLEIGTPALPALEEAAQAGRLDALLPGAGDLMSLRRPGLGHTLTVGAHSLTAATMLPELAAGGGTLARSAAAVEHPRALSVAALAHDVGKIAGGADHPAHGAEPAREAALRLGLPERLAADVADLVRLHLALIETATRADIDDEDAVLRAASRIGRRELVAPLHLLTVADSRSTGPSTWTPWMDALLGGLVARLDVALSDDVDGAGLASRADAVRAAALASMSSALDAERAFVEAAPMRYLASRDPGAIAADARLVAELSAAQAAESARVSVKPGPVESTWVVGVAAKDRPELFARLAGAISLAGLDILSADAYPAPGALALDVFTVASATRAAVDHSTWITLERLVRAALKDRLELETRLDERKRHYPVRAQGPVSVETGSAGWDTTVRVKAPDRPGLLYDLARAVSASGLDIRWAKVLTVEGMAIDTFHVVGPDGRAEDDPGVLGHLSMRIRETV